MSFEQWAQRHILVTGGSRGIGKAIAHHFARLGAQVIATSQSEEGCLRIVAEAASKGLSIEALPLQLSCEASRTHFFEKLKERPQSIDTLINNAGQTADQIALRLKKHNWYQVIESNLSGTFFITQDLLKPMLKQRFGRIITIGSVVAATGNVGQTNYCASKAGLIGLSKALALEVGSRNITVNMIAPGFIATEMTDGISEEQKEAFLSKIPAGRFGQPDDIAHACVFLAGVGGSYISGQVLHINGGVYCGN